MDKDHTIVRHLQSVCPSIIPTCTCTTTCTTLIPTYPSLILPVQKSFLPIQHSFLPVHQSFVLVNQSPTSESINHSYLSINHSYLSNTHSYLSNTHSYLSINHPTSVSINHPTCPTLMSINHSYLSINHPTSPTLIPTCPSITLPVHQSIIPTCPSIMYEIIIMESVLESGNLSGSFVVSMSKARTTGSCQEKKWNRLHNWSWIRAMTEKSWLRNHGTQSSFTDAKITSWKPSISEIWPTVHVLTSSTRSSISTCCKITTITTICLPPTSLLVTAETSHSLPSTWPSTSPDAAQLVFQQAGDCRGSGKWGKKVVICWQHSVIIVAIHTGGTIS